MSDLGMPLYQCQPPTGYADKADAWANSGALINRMNVALALASNRLPGTVLNDTDAVQRVDLAFAKSLSPATANTIGKASNPAERLALTLGSPEFQRR
jgi:uncharacterized protein (DUF1800 family)